MKVNQCIQWILNPDGPGSRQCRHTGTHETPNGQPVCWQHARSYDRKRTR